MMPALSNSFSSKIPTSALFHREVPIRVAISMVYSEPVVIMRMIDSCEKSKGARCKKIATIIITVKAIWVFTWSRISKRSHGFTGPLPTLPSAPLSTRSGLVNTPSVG